MSVCLIVAFYENDRESAKREECLKYQDFQKQALQKYKHSLEKIIFVISIDDLTEEKIENKDNITYYYRNNKYLSFGAWFDTVNKFKDMYDYFIFSEDDYIFVQDNFDTRMKEAYEKRFNAEGYMCTYYIPRGAMSTVGIISKKELQKLEYFKHFKVKPPMRPEWMKNMAMEGFIEILNFHNFATDFPVFPYWRADCKLFLYCYDKIHTKTPEEIKEQTLLTCIQFLDDKLEFDFTKKYEFKYDTI